MKLVILTLTLLTVCGIFATELEQWKQFKTQFGKHYGTRREDLYRRRIFNANVKKIAEHEKLRKQGKATFSMGITQFADMTHEEYIKTMLSPRQHKVKDNVPLFNASLIKSTADPTSVDWRTSGCVRSVANGGTCSLWPVTSLIPIEVQQCTTSGSLTRLSIQDIWDCSGSGCSGFANEAYDCIVIDGGVDTEASYPATGAPSTCKFNSNSIGARITGYERVSSGDEVVMQSAVANIGPLSTAIDASQSSFMFYISGIYYEPACSSVNLNLAVPVIGYGTDSGSDYWLCQNNWGTSWGEQGYFRIARNRANNCGIATDVTYPVGVSL